MRKTEQHYSLLLTSAKKRGQLSTKEASELLNVSQSTARRLFGELEKKGKIIRTFGGIVYPTNSEAVEDYVFDLEVPQHMDLKKMIGYSAAQTIQSGDIIYIDAGSTTLQFSYSLCERIKNGEVSDLIIVTNSIKHIHAFGNMCTVFAAGGEYQKNSDSFVGSFSEEFVSKFNYSKCFLGCDGFSVAQGASSKNMDSAKICQCVLKRSKKAYLLMVANKIENPSFYSFAPSHDIDSIFTNDDLSDEIIAKIKDADIDLRIVTE